MNLNEDDKKWFEALLDTKLERPRVALEASIMNTETRLLTESHKWASPTELRIKSHVMAIRAIDLELEDPKERVTRLEPKH